MNVYTVVSTESKAAITRARREVKETIESIQKSVELFQKMLPVDFELPGEPTSIEMFKTDLYVNYPRSQVLINEMREALKNLDSNVVTVREEDNTKETGVFEFILTPRPWDIRWVHIVLSAKDSKAKCQLIQVGTTKVVREVPVYEVICPEGDNPLNGNVVKEK